MLGVNDDRAFQHVGELLAAVRHHREVVVLDVFGAREEPLPGVTGALVASAVTKPVNYQPDLSLVAKQVAALSAPGDVVITMGAGDVTMLAGPILDALRSKTDFGNGTGRATT